MKKHITPLLTADDYSVNLFGNNLQNIVTTNHTAYFGNQGHIKFSFCILHSMKTCPPFWLHHLLLYKQLKQ